MRRLPIPIFPEYEITEDGTVFGLSGGPLKPSVDTCGYPLVMLGKRSDGTKTRPKFRIHKLVAMTFLGETPEGLEICHRDDDKFNNHVSNLYFGTHSENISEAYRNGRIPSGSAHRDSTIDDDRVALIKAGNAAGIPNSRIASALRISDVTVKRVIVGNHWSAVPEWLRPTTQKETGMLAASPNETTNQINDPNVSKEIVMNTTVKIKDIVRMLNNHIRECENDTDFDTIRATLAFRAEHYATVFSTTLKEIDPQLAALLYRIKKQNGNLVGDDAFQLVDYGIAALDLRAPEDR